MIAKIPRFGIGLALSLSLAAALGTAGAARADDEPAPAEPAEAAPPPEAEPPPEATPPPEAAPPTETASPDAEQPKSASGPHKSPEVGRFFAGVGRSSLAGDAKDFGASAWQWGLQLERAVTDLADGLDLTGALDYRYARHEKSLDPVRINNTSAKATEKRFDISLLIGLRFTFLEDFSVFTQIGPDYQRRSLFIDAASGGDYYNGTGFSYLWRLGAAYDICDVLVQAFYARSGDKTLTSGRLKYDLRKVDYNGASSTFGLELGYAL